MPEAVSIVIPAYNEEGSIAAVIGELRSVLAAAGVKKSEILVVDDGSRDRTAEAASAAQGVTVLRHPHNIGYGKALKTGIAAAAHDTIVITDADGTYPLSKIPELLAEYEAKKFDMLVGQRTGAHYLESVTKAPLRLLLKWLIEFTTGRSVPDVNSGLRVFSKATALKYLPRLSNTFSFTTSMTLAYMMSYRFVAYFPIDYHRRVGSSKVRLIRDSLRTLQYIVQAIAYFNPLKIFILGSLASLAISAACFYRAGCHPAPWLHLMGVGGIFCALIIFFLGVLADVVRQSSDQ